MQRKPTKKDPQNIYLSIKFCHTEEEERGVLDARAWSTLFELADDIFSKPWQNDEYSNAIVEI